MSDGGAADRFEPLLERARAIVGAPAGARHDTLMRLCRLLAEVPYYDRVGFCGGRFAAELDIDSHTVAPFGPADRAFLENVASLAGRLFES